MPGKLSALGFPGSQLEPRAAQGPTEVWDLLGWRFPKPHKAAPVDSGCALSMDWADVRAGTRGEEKIPACHSPDLPGAHPSQCLPLEQTE